MIRASPAAKADRLSEVLAHGRESLPGHMVVVEPDAIRRRPLPKAR